MPNQPLELSPAELDMIAEGCPNCQEPACAPVEAAPGNAAAPAPRFGFTTLAAIRALASILISVLILCAGVIAYTTLA